MRIPHSSSATPLLRRALPWALGSALLLSSCGGGGGAGLDEPTGPGDTAPGQLLTVGPGPHPRIDLPGRISVLLQVLTEDGRPVAGLEATDFRLEEDGAAVSLTESAQRLLPKPRVYQAYAHLLLDRSGSVSGTSEGLEAERAAAHAFVDAALAEPSVALAVSWFAGDPGLIPGSVPNSGVPLGFTSDAAALHAAIDSDEVVVTSTSTNLYGAFVAGLDLLADAAADAEEADLEFFSLSQVTFTDGTDQAGLVSQAQALASLEAGVTVSDGTRPVSSYTIGLGAEIDPAALGLLGPDGFVQAANLPDLTPGFVDVASEVRDLANSFYLIGYLSPKLAGTHDLTVTAVSDGGSASLDLVFSADLFSGGGGFLDSRGSEELGLDPLLPGAVDGLLAEAEGAATVALASESAGGASRSLRFQGWDADLAPTDRYGSASGLLVSAVDGDDHLTCAGLARTSAGLLALVTTRNGPADPSPRIALLRIADDGALEVAGPLADPDTGLARALALCAEEEAAFVLGEVDAEGVSLWRVLSQPFAFDAAFGGNGRATWSGEPTATGVDVALAEAGSPAVLATLPGGGVRLVRFDSTGALVSAFGAGGVASAPALGLSAEAPSALAVDAQGRLVVVGSVGSPAQPAAWRFQFDGSPDTEFRGMTGQPQFATGLVLLPSVYLQGDTAPFPQGASLARVAARPDGSLLAAGTRPNGEGHTDAVWLRLQASGALPPTGPSPPGWNGVGFLIEDGTLGDDYHEEVRHLAVRSDGWILTGGRSAPGPSAAGPVVWIDGDARRVLN